jgi:Rieske Fe-S protein
MERSRNPEAEPLWREEFSVFADTERYVARRQFAKFLVLTSLGMLTGNLWILVRSIFHREPVYPATPVASVDELPVDGVKMCRYPGPDDPCILVRTATDTWVAYGQKCTHLACAVYYEADRRRLACPCHVGYFGVDDGRVLQGPPPRPLPRVVLKRERDTLLAAGMDLQTEA